MSKKSLLPHLLSNKVSALAWSVQRGPLATLMIFNNCRSDSRGHFVADATHVAEISDKIERISRADLIVNSNTAQLTNPDHRIVFGEQNSGTRLSRYARAFQGISPADTPKYSVRFWELFDIHEPWCRWQGASNQHRFIGGTELLLRYGRELIKDANDGRAYVRSDEYLSRKSIVVSLMRRFCASINYETYIDTNVAAVLPIADSYLLPLWCYLISGQFTSDVRSIDKKVNLTNATVTKVPFELDYWKGIAAEKYPNGLPQPCSSDPTQWIFAGHPRGSLNPSATDTEGNPMRPGLAEHPLQVAVARLLGYRWPRQTGSGFIDCPAIEEPDEIDRASVADSSGIVCLPALAGEPAAAERLRAVLSAAWDSDWREGITRECLAAEDAKATDIDEWLAEEFFEGHCKLFHQTPFVWHIWDGAKGGFSALVNYHRLCEPNGDGRRVLEKLRDTFLGEWVAEQRRAVAFGETGVEDRLLAAEHLRDQLTKIIVGEPPYDIFVRWKPPNNRSAGSPISTMEFA